MTYQDDNSTETSAEATPTIGRPRAPALMATVDGVAHKLLKYAFPTKAITFTVTVNGEEAQAATTAGRGSSYTYLLINNTGFYLPKNVVLESGADISIAFPDGYPFDDEQAVRVSTYKPKLKRAPVEGEDVADATPADPYTDAPASVEEEAPKAKRRGRK